MDEIIAILEEAKALIQSNIRDKGISASGRTANGFRVEAYEGGAKLIYSTDSGGAPLATLEGGRKPGKVPEGFTAIIKQWANDRGITFSSDKELRSFAGAVAYGKIRKDGYGRPSPSKYGSVDKTVYSNVVFETAVKLYDEIPKVVVNYMRNKR